MLGEDEMHFSLLVIADGTKTLWDMMQPFNYQFAWENGMDANAKWDWYVVGGRWRGLIRAKIGGHGERSGYDFEKNPDDWSFGRFGRPYEDGRFDVVRVRDIEHLNPYMLHDMLTPDGIWHNSEFYVPDGLDGEYFFENVWFHDGMIERLKERYPDCLAIIVDYHW